MYNSNIELFIGVPGSGEGAAVSGTLFPVAMSLADFVFLRYRIKSWNVTFSARWKYENHEEGDHDPDTGDDFTYAFHEGQCSGHATMTTSAANEAALAVIEDRATWSGNALDAGSNSVFELDYGPGSPTPWQGYRIHEIVDGIPETYIVDLVFALEIGADYVTEDGSYVPKIQFSVLASSFTFDEFGQPTTTPYGIFSLNSEAPTESMGDALISLHTHALRVYAPRRDIYGGDQGQQAEWSIFLSPREYWRYDPRDGLGPIYSAHSGSELRDPFSVQEPGTGSDSTTGAPLFNDETRSQYTVPLTSIAY